MKIEDTAVHRSRRYLSLSFSVHCCSQNINDADWSQVDVVIRYNHTATSIDALVVYKEPKPLISPQTHAQTGERASVIHTEATAAPGYDTEQLQDGRVRVESSGVADSRLFRAEVHEGAVRLRGQAASVLCVCWCVPSLQTRSPKTGRSRSAVFICLCLPQ